jgi:DNA polymerase-3 subunit delta
VIYLYHGKDDYRVHGAVRELRERLAATDDGATGMLESNTAVLDGASLKPQELLGHATAVPFLASNRLVIVEGLLKALGETKRGRGKKAKDDDPLAPWREAFATLGDKSAVPETTTLVFVEGVLSEKNPIFALVAPLSRTVQFDELKSGELPTWISSEAKRLGVNVDGRAVATLAQLVGPDLWTLTNELQKLAAYAEGAIVDQQMVESVVSSAREAKMWDMTDAVLAGDDRQALAAMQQLRQDGEPTQVLFAVLVTQYRQIAIVKDLRDRRVAQNEITRRTGMKNFRLDKVTALANRYSWPVLREAYARLLDADLNVKRGLQDAESSLQLLVHELCALSPRGSAPKRGAYAR